MGPQAAHLIFFSLSLKCTTYLGKLCQKTDTKNQEVWLTFIDRKNVCLSKQSDSNETEPQGWNRSLKVI